MDVFCLHQYDLRLSQGKDWTQLVSAPDHFRVPSQVDRANATMEGDDMAPNHQLAQLIDGVKAANNWSDPKLVRNAKEKGHVLSKSNISRYRGELVSIKGEVINALAAGLRVTPAQVAIAAVESMGISLPAIESPTPEQAVRLDTDLSARDRESVLALLSQLRADSPTSTRASGKAHKGQEALVDQPQPPAVEEPFLGGLAPDDPTVDPSEDDDDGDSLRRGQV